MLVAFNDYRLDPWIIQSGNIYVTTGIIFPESTRNCNYNDLKDEIMALLVEIFP